jgi:hypothetical protein
MNAAEFHEHFRIAGERALAPLGFVYRAKAWHHRTDDRQVSLCPEDTKFGVGFGVKYLTLALWHFQVEPPPSIKVRSFKSNSWLCPVRVSPTLLPGLVDSGFDPRVWDCPAPWMVRGKTHLPVYYGGPDRRILADPNADPGENARALLHHLREDGITDLSEEAARSSIAAAAHAAGCHGLAWAEHLTVEKTATLLARHAKPLSGSPMEGWLPAYARAAGARGGPSLRAKA